MKKFVLTMNFILIMSLIVVGQSLPLPLPTPSSPNMDRGNDADQGQDQINSAKRRRDLEKSRSETIAFVAKVNESLSIPQNYQDKYPQYLKNDKAGLARIFPDKNCDQDGFTVNVQELERCGNLPPIKGFGSLYSFRLNEVPNSLSVKGIQNFIGQSDIHFIDGKFVVGKDLTQDIIAEIGNANLEDASVTSDPVTFLSNWKPARNHSEFNDQKILIEKGIHSGNYLFSNVVDVKQDNTYIIRSISYKTFRYGAFWNTDLLVLFRVIGQEPDGSIILIWKRLKRSDAPLLKA